MNNASSTPDDNNAGETATAQLQPGTSLTDITGDKDGRNREWEDRGRVNLEVIPEGTRTMVERDFEPEQPIAPETGKDSSPAY